MNRNRIYSLLITLSLSSCYGGGVLVIPAETHSHTTIVTHNAPPPHAPAHGYRHRYDNHELKFDTGYGVYLVLNNPGLYFYNDHYIRFYNDSWQITNRLQDRWRPARQNDVPLKLERTKHHDKKRYAEVMHGPDKHYDNHHDEQRDNHHDSRHDNQHANQHTNGHDKPKHGQRRHYQDHELKFDSRIDAYIIVNQPGIYFHDDHYLRFYRNVWQATSKLDGRWRAAKRQEVPEKLTKARHPKKDKPAKTDARKSTQYESAMERATQRIR